MHVARILPVSTRWLDGCENFAHGQLCIPIRKVVHRLAVTILYPKTKRISVIAMYTIS